jgi:hypothetical protein
MATAEVGIWEEQDDNANDANGDTCELTMATFGAKGEPCEEDDEEEGGSVQEQHAGHTRVLVRLHGYTAS